MLVMLMLMQVQMEVIRRNCFLFLVILLCGSFALSLEYNRPVEEVFFSQLVDPESGEVDEAMAEVLWINCRQDLINLNEAFGYLNLYNPEDTHISTNSFCRKSCTLPKENIQKLINVLHPQLKQTLVDCIRKNNLVYLVSGEESGSNIWYSQYLKSLFSRRKLATEKIAEAPASSPSPSPAKSNRPPASRGDQFFPPNTDDSSLQPPAEESSSADPDSSSTVAVKKGNNNKTVIIAVVVTASVTFVVAALLFLCCSRCFGTGSGAKQNDESPLLSLSLSDFSGGSSHASYAFASSIKEEKLGHQPFGNNSSLNKKASSLDGYSNNESDVRHGYVGGSQSFGAAANTSAESSDASNNFNARLPPPPGRVSLAVPGMPPLKPPPGRADPLPPEPPAPMRTAPPPPVPPPALKSSSASAGPRPPGPPPPPPIPAGTKTGPRPPPPPSKGPAPPLPPSPMLSKAPRPPSGLKRPSNTFSSEVFDSQGEADAPKTKLKPFFWDKVAANPEHSMVWNQIKSGSFQFNEEMIETLFGYTNVDKNKNERKKESSSQDSLPLFIQILDQKKAQNLSILLRALNVTTEEVCDALNEGNELPVELLQTLLKMAPTADEELKLRLFNGEISRLGPAERFLKTLVEIPFAFKRMEALLFMCTLNEEVTTTRESFETLEVACKELRGSRLFLKLLEAVLKTGNRMNDGTFRGGAQAFKLDTLLKLSDVKGVDGKTTLLHFVVQEIIRTEGIRAARAARGSKSFSSLKSEDLLEEVSDDTEEHYRSLGLQVVSRLSSELENVKKAAAVDADNLTRTVAKLGHALLKTRDFLNSEMKSTEEESGFHETLKSFVQNAEFDVMSLLEEEKRIVALVKSTGDYFHGNAGRDEGLRLFIIVRDFLIMLDKVCKEVRVAPRKPAKTQRREVPNAPSSSEPRFTPPSSDPRQRLFPAIAERRIDNSNSSSDEESP